jgi:hypothetical protein
MVLEQVYKEQLFTAVKNETMIVKISLGMDSIPKEH